ncbi:MAG: RibD family protein [Cyclobacteriaceae bacterium]
MSEPSFDCIWSFLLELNKRLKGQPDIEFISVLWDKDQQLSFFLNEPIDDPYILIDLGGRESVKSEIHIKCQTPFSFDVVKNSNLSSARIQFLELYLPYALLPFFSSKLNQTFTISHFAQSLDGRIASTSGDSKWIGNNENLIHAHRMRALCDSVLVGSGTLLSDNPKLNVRHVSGDDPIKIIVGGDDLNLSDFEAPDNETIFFSQNHIDSTFGFKTYRLKKGSDKNYDVKEILNILNSLEISSVYLEGGAYTSSQFLKQSCISQVQIHMSPLILGSGQSGFQFGGIQSMDEAIRFKSYKYQSVGDHVMFVGEL